MSVTTSEMSFSITVVTTLFPSEPRPFEGIFAQRRWEAMRGRGHDVHVVHPQPWGPPAWLPGPVAWRESARMSRREERGGVPVRRPRYLHLPGRALGNSKRLASAARAELGRPDAVVLDYAWPAAAMAPWLKSQGIPCVISGRGSDVLQVAGVPDLKRALASHLRSAGHWCGVSQDLVRAMDELADQPGQGRLVPNGVDTERFRPRSRARARERLGWELDAPLVLCVGHLIPRKDPLLALEAFLQGAPKEARMAFLGRGPLEAELAGAVAGSEAAERVRLLGERPAEELADWYAASDLLILTSTREGRPNVVLEALASGRSVLATPAGGTAEILPEERMLATSREPRQLGRALADLLEHPSDPEQLAASVRSLSWEASCEALEACLQSAVEACS